MAHPAGLLRAWAWAPSMGLAPWTTVAVPYSMARLDELPLAKALLASWFWLWLEHWIRRGHCWCWYGHENGHGYGHGRCWCGVGGEGTA